MLTLIVKSRQCETISFSGKGTGEFLNPQRVYILCMLCAEILRLAVDPEEVCIFELYLASFQINNNNDKAFKSINYSRVICNSKTLRTKTIWKCSENTVFPLPCNYTFIPNWCLGVNTYACSSSVIACCIRPLLVISAWLQHPQASLSLNLAWAIMKSITSDNQDWYEAILHPEGEGQTLMAETSQVVQWLIFHTPQCREAQVWLVVSNQDPTYCN